MYPYVEVMTELTLLTFVDFDNFKVDMLGLLYNTICGVHM